jgi:hypothetical protein
LSELAENPNIITVPIEWEKVDFPKNRANCGKFTLITTQEIMGKDQRDKFRHLVDDEAVGNMIWLPNGAHPDEVRIPDDPAPERGVKSRTQRLYNALFVLWKLEGEKDGELFEDYRAKRMEEIIAFVREKIAKYD